MSPNRYYLFNRALDVSPDGWIHIVPKGELNNASAGMVQVLDDMALDSILSNLESEKARLGNRWPGLYAGREHFVYDDEQDSAALAWFKDFEKRSDGIWANSNGLTPTGRQAIANAEYKFTSFVADRKDTQPLGTNKARILRIDTVGFTNQANGKELLTPITNRRTQTAAAAVSPRAQPADLGKSIFEAAVTIVCNRLRYDFRGYDMGHALVSTRNRDLFEKPYDTLDTALRFGRLTNRIQNRAGLSEMAATNRSAADAAALTKRFAPALSSAPAARQWDVLSRAVDSLEQANVPDRLCNRTVSTERVRATSMPSDPADEVSKSDWKAANGRADEVFALLDRAANQSADRGRVLETAPAVQIRGLFRRQIEELMNKSGLNRRQAFDRLKETEPIFWTLAMLSFEP